MTAIDVMKISPIVPVVAVHSVDEALKLADALMAGGIFMMEITLRTEAGLAAIKAISEQKPKMHVGAGTVINKEEFRQAVDFGAQFVFSPGISQELIDTAQLLKIPFLPGVATASEVMMAKNSGLEGCKLFPATVVGGLGALKAFSGPFSSIKFCPTGGVNINNFTDFLALDNVLCVGGSWIVDTKLIKAGKFDEITNLCQEALSKI